MTFLEPRDDQTRTIPAKLSIRISPQGDLKISGDSKETIEAAIHSIHSADYRVSLQAQLAKELRSPDGRIEKLTFLFCVGTVSALIFFLMFQMLYPTQCKANVYNQFSVSRLRG